MQSMMGKDIWLNQTGRGDRGELAKVGAPAWGRGSDNSLVAASAGNCAPITGLVILCWVRRGCGQRSQGPVRPSQGTATAATEVLPLLRLLFALSFPSHPASLSLSKSLERELQENGAMGVSQLCLTPCELGLLSLTAESPTRAEYLQGIHSW